MNQCILNTSLSEFICRKLLNYLNSYLKLEPIEMEKLYLGIIVITFNMLEMFIIFTISFFIGILKEVILFFIIFASLRFTAAGIHCKNSVMCLFFTSISHIGSAYVAINNPLSIDFNLLISIICMFFLYKYAPADTENRPILGEDHRRKLKIKTVITALTLIILNLLLRYKVLFTLTMFAIIVQTISVLPYTYKIMKVNYNNYKNIN